MCVRVYVLIQPKKKRKLTTIFLCVACCWHLHFPSLFLSVTLTRPLQHTCTQQQMCNFFSMRVIPPHIVFFNEIKGKLFYDLHNWLSV